MATNTEIVEQLMGEIGSSAHLVRRKLESSVGEVTIAILIQNFGRHYRLEKNQEITADPNFYDYRLNADFNTAQDMLVEVSSEGNFVREVEIVTEKEHFTRRGNSQYGGVVWAYIVTKANGRSGPGEYLVLAHSRTGATYYKFFYYRKPTVDDTDLIVNLSAITEGVRAKHAEYWPDSGKHLGVYQREKQTEISTPARRGAAMHLTPNKQQRKINRQMRDIGRGG